ncbi:MAG: ribosome-associated translation inhibitor RaiA [Clostridia bacterium]|nr:ribosome-associated translation inhibitor RaiA [Clostridia bacterium]
MKISITGKKFRVTEAISKKINDKLSKFDKFFDTESDATVVLRSRKNKEIIEITIYQSGTMFRSEVEDDNILNALDKSVDIIERQIRKNKTRLARRLKIGAFDKTVLAESQWKDLKEDEIKITKVKNFVMKPMTPEEAVLQMNLLGHEFFLFTNSETGANSVVYKKKNDEYGLLNAVSE